MAVASNGACAGDPPSKVESDDEDGIVDLETMNRYKDEKFKLVGKRKFLPLEAGFAFDDEEKTNNANGPNKKGKVRAHRVEDTGYEYKAEYEEFDDEDVFVGEELAPFEP